MSSLLDYAPRHVSALFSCISLIHLNMYLFSWHIYHPNCVGREDNVERVSHKPKIFSLILTCLSRPLLRLLYGDIGFVYPACL
jgi:hypothetical protein